MRPLVVDASTAAAWLLDLPWSGSARSLLGFQRPLMAPELIHSEVGNLLWKSCRAGGISSAQAQEALERFFLAPLRVIPARPHAERALALALQYQRSFYDSLYLALAEAESALFVTADERFVNAMQGTPLAGFVHWIGASGPLD